MNELLSETGISIFVMLLAAFGLGALVTKMPKLMAGALIMAGVCALATPFVVKVSEELPYYYESDYDWDDEDWFYDYDDDYWAYDDPWYFDYDDDSWDYDESWYFNYDGDDWYFEEETQVYDEGDTFWNYDDPADIKDYYYSGNTVDGKMIIDFSITLYPDGTYSWYETPYSSFLGMGNYEIEDDILIMTDDEEMTGTARVNKFLMKDDTLVYIADGSSNFLFVQLKDGEEFYLNDNPVEGWMEKLAD